MIYHNKEILKQKEIISKLEKYCSFSEKSSFDIKKKLFDWKIHNNHDEIISHLIENNYINEERYAVAYSIGKFNSKKWGKQKIYNNLKVKGIDNEVILKSLNEIPENIYLETISELILKKSKSIKEKNIFKKNAKVVRFLLQKGYESDLIWQQIKKNIQND